MVLNGSFRLRLSTLLAYVYIFNRCNNIRNKVTSKKPLLFKAAIREEEKYRLDTH